MVVGKAAVMEEEMGVRVPNAEGHHPVAYAIDHDSFHFNACRVFCVMIP